MNFSDQSHINRVRDAMWQRSANATVMVGAGFSRNGISLRSDESLPPTWTELADVLYAKLYPPPEDRSRFGHGDEAQSKDILRLAQEYEAVFGRNDLHSQIQSTIRNDEFIPDVTHERLLRLPWRDVITTNWDTLLERANTKVTDRSYTLVRTVEDIPLTVSPRIIKLHGTVAPRYQLIVTEEDYRTYPENFAPFVNTVRQAMMETVLLLIGFSGEDPNFLHWSGWVRDKLSDSAPKIYLAGWLDLPIHRRRMLENRNIVPIDLARHPAAVSWRKHSIDVCHERATDWILHSLESGKPYNLATWPNPMDGKDKKIPKYLEPLEKKPVNTPIKEPSLRLDSNKELTDEKKRQLFLELIRVWKHNRTTTYPGWLSAPAVVRGAMRGSTIDSLNDTVTLLDALSLLKPTEQLSTLFELIWHWDIQLEPIMFLEPISDKIHTVASNLLNLVDVHAKTIAGNEIEESNWLYVFEAWSGIVLALVRTARLRCNKNEFDKYLSYLSPFSKSQINIHQSILHEKCLWAIFTLNYPSLEEQLAQWHVEKVDPIWMMRKAALLFEIGRDDEAHMLNDQALLAIRRMPMDSRRVDSQSRESWALLCSRRRLDFQTSFDEWFENQKRWDELTALKCNAPVEIQLIEDAIKGKGKSAEGRPFDLGMEWRTGYSVSMSEYFRWASALRAIRLTEVVGLPPKIGNCVIASSTLELAVRELCLYDLELPVRIALRSANYDSRGTLNFVLSRVLIAQLPIEAVDVLVQDCVNAIEYAISQFEKVSSKSRTYWLTRLQVFMESLSRFVVRLHSDQVDEALSKALKWYRNENIANMLFAIPLRNLLTRIWEALPEKQRLTRIPNLFDTPIVGLELFANERADIRNRYPDPCELLNNERKDFWLHRDDGSDWTNVVNSVVLGLEKGGEARKRAAMRMGLLIDAKVLTENCYDRISLALWGENYSETGELPTQTDLFEWAFLILPQPQRGIAESRFRAKWLNPRMLSRKAPLECLRVLHQVGTALKNLRIHDYPFVLSGEDKSFLLKVVNRWTREELPDHLLNGKDAVSRFFSEQDDEEFRKQLDGFKHVLVEIDLSQEDARELWQKIKTLNNSRVQARSLYPGLIKGSPDFLDEIVEEWRIALVSEDTVTARNAIDALQFWLQTTQDTDTELVLPPSDLVREVGIILLTRRKTALLSALEFAKWIFRKGKPEHKNLIQDYVVEGLEYLSKELRYDHRFDDELDVPLLRWLCTTLAVTMFEGGLENNTTILHWLKIANNDPFPKVRYCVVRTEVGKC